jgi:hypothetical protein
MANSCAPLGVGISLPNAARWIAAKTRHSKFPDGDGTMNKFLMLFVVAALAASAAGCGCCSCFTPAAPAVVAAPAPVCPPPVAACPPGDPCAAPGVTYGYAPATGW